MKKLKKKIRKGIHHQLMLNHKIGRIDGTLEDALCEMFDSAITRTVGEIVKWSHEEEKKELEIMGTSAMPELRRFLSNLERKK